MDLKNLGLKFSLFVVLSAALHIAAAASLYYLAPEKKPPPKERAYVVSIVPPEPPLPEGEEKPPALAKPSLPAPRKTAPPRPKVEKEERIARAPVARPEGRKEAGPPGGVIDKEAPAEEGMAPAGPGVGPASIPKGAGRERLFDPDVLAGVIGKREKSKGAESGTTFDTREVRYYGYMRKLKERIEAVWEYPREAAEKGIYGDLVIRFVIKRDGTLGSVELVRTSGWRMLDQAAMEALRDGSPYWPLPEDWGTESFTVTGHFIYSISGLYYVR